METTANDDWKADMLAAWEAGELELFCWGGWVPCTAGARPSLTNPREFYRRRSAAEKPQEPKPADPNAAMIARDGAPTSPKYAEYAEPTTSAPSAPTGLTACAPFTHKLGGWGL